MLRVVRDYNQIMLSLLPEARGTLFAWGPGGSPSPK